VFVCDVLDNDVLYELADTFEEFIDRPRFRTRRRGITTVSTNPRYAGKPLLRLIECYVLWAIDELPENEAAALEGMTPKLQDLYRIKGSWQEVIAKTLDFNPQMPDRFRAMWTRNLEIARQNGVELSPQQFAEMVVDENFAPED
jgi:hypothetical protein